MCGDASATALAIPSNRAATMRKIDGCSVWIGNAHDARAAREICTAGIQAVVELAVNEASAALPRELVHCRFPLVDGSGNTPWLLRGAIALVADLVRAGTPTLVCCGAGMSRSPAVTATALALAAGIAPAEALTRVTHGAPADVSPALWMDIQSAASTLT
jgi:hypothetical protein